MTEIGYSRRVPAEHRIDPPDWEQAVSAGEGPQLIVGGPGTGKTEFLVRRAAWLLERGGVEPEQLLLLSFSRRGIADLRARLERGLGSSVTALPASTFHSLASRLLERYGSSALGWNQFPALLTGPEQVALVRRLLESERRDAWPLPFRGLLSTASFAEEVTDFILRCREQLIDADRLAVLTRTRTDWRALPAFLVRYEAELVECGRIDYGTLLSSAVRLLDFPNPAAAVGRQYRFLLVDEYQDTTIAQVELLKRMYAQHRNLTVVADPYQSIYSFRGADLQNVARFPTEFPDAAGVPAPRYVLTTSFRVPAGILEAAVRVTAGALPGVAGPVAAAPGRGAVETYGFDQQTEEAEWIAREIERLNLEEGLPYGRMAVFVRSKRRFLPEMSRVLERRGIPHDLPDARLADHPAVRVILDCVAAATAPEPEAGRALRRILLGPLFSVPLGRLREIERDRLRTSMNWPRSIDHHLGDATGLASLLSDSTWATALPAVEGFWHVWTTLDQFIPVVADPARKDERAAWSSLGQVLGRLFDRDPHVTLADYARLAQEEDFEARPLLSYRTPVDDRLTLTTLHQSKGLEFEVVFIADAVEGVFPDLRARESLLGSRHLSRSLPTDPALYLRFRLQEEMRLAYTAMTRASRRVVWTATSSGMEEGQGMPSRFLALVAGIDSSPVAARRPPDRTRPVTRQEAEAWLRRILRDPDEGGARRTAALTLLVHGDSWGLRHPTFYAGVRPRGPDRGLLPAGITLSPSQAETYAGCPRRYAFERRLHVGDEPTSFLIFGTLIHDVLQGAEQRAVEEGLRHAELGGALAELDAIWDPTQFGGEPWAEAWYRRATDILTHLYEHWPGAGTPLALERPLTWGLDGVTWRGQADRVEIEDGIIRVVDYKTGTRVPSAADAAVSIQLGFYLMALREDPETAERGRAEQAEFWFPAKLDQKTVAVRKLDPSRLAEVREAMVAAAHGISAEAWPATPNPHCRSCRVRLVCPEWPEGREAFAG